MKYPEQTAEAVELLKRLIAIPSVSRDETAAADQLEQFMTDNGLTPKRHGNNIWLTAHNHDDRRPTLLLNAHIDTVKPAASWTRSPFEPTTEGDKIYGLGSNDDGGSLVALLQAWRILIEGADSNRLPYNLIYLASCEEEVSGIGGVSSVLPLLPHIDVAIVGEPTDMQPAIAEKGLMVIDGIAHGKAGHAARNEGINAIYEALDDFCWLRDHRFDRTSPLLGPVKMTLTVVNSGTQHNVVPDECHFIIDVRSNELYTNQEIFGIIQSHLKSEIKARSYRLNPSHIDETHPIVSRCKAMGKTPFGSPTLSDQALMPFPSLKMGPGQSNRSHMADEYIRISEIDDAIATYVDLLAPQEP